MEELIEEKILEIAQQRGPTKTFCPSEVTRALYPDHWRQYMPLVRQIAQQLANQNQIIILQKGRPVDIHTAKGPIRLQLKK